MHILAADSSSFWWVVLIFALIVVLVFFIAAFQFLGLYIRALVSGARVSMLELVGMKLRKVNASIIVNSRVQAMRAGLQMSQAEMESHVLAGGRLSNVINAMIA